MIDAALLQRRLGVVADGHAGPATYAAFFARVAQRPLDDRLKAIGAGAAANLPALIDTPLRLIHFAGQTCVESAAFRCVREMWGPTLAQTRYEGRRDLGNTQPGDGKRYLGRGLLQITGRANYAAVGKRLGIDLVTDPALAELPDIAVATACDYWRAHALNRWADADDVLVLSRAINRGNPFSKGTPNGLAERRAATARARALVLPA